MRAKSIVLFLYLVIFFGLQSTAQETCKVLKDGIKEEYRGGCKKGLAHGYGDAEGIDKYLGYFRRGLPHGKGTYSWSTGEKYIGEWENGLRHGEGQYQFFSNGKDTVIIGVWKYDEYVGIVSERPYNIDYRNNVGRISFTKINDNGAYVRIKFMRSGGEATDISDMILYGSSGAENDSRMFTGYENVEFPFTGKVRFSAPNLFRSASLNCELRYRIYEPGAWVVSVSY